MAVTVKTVKKKPLSLKKSPGPELAEGAEGVDSVEGQAGGAAPVVMAGKPAPGKPAVVAKPASYTFAGVCAILEFLMFAAILTLQIIEWKFYLEPKSAFPPFGTLLPIPGASSVSSAPVAEEAMDDMPVEEDAGDAFADEAEPAE